MLLHIKTEKGKGYWSRNGSSECDVAAEDYYMRTNDNGILVPEPCADGVDCSSPGTTTASMSLEPGFYKFKDTSQVVYECLHPKNCEGTTDGSTGDDLCRAGAEGPLCSVCHGAFFLDGGAGQKRRHETSYFRNLPFRKGAIFNAKRNILKMRKT